ncbi:polyhydroxyalkanoate synthesis repressor PhaR [Pseudomonas saliphila]|uniref:polyhydroxyalkanoate synthesis repressor PhaR n=1 Tax=Pseudomonas saliphila TaxID=2586906 RepID=UPI00123C45EA|nr:polyhydroxyalkanoate synthesis repressor PhaR [Pseudomonas saliphila]
MSDQTQNPTRLIKKYPNRRLYDTHTSRHLTLADIRRLVVEQVPFQVVDAKSGEDITRSILLQIIQEAENEGEPIFSSDMLQSIIRSYGPYQGMLGDYLDRSIQGILEAQAQAGVQTSQVWSEFMQKQVPVMQDLMRQYLEQTGKMHRSPQDLFNVFGGVDKPTNRDEPNKKKGDEE